MTGCDRGGAVGGPGAGTAPSKPPLSGMPDDTFNLTVPAVTLKQGATAPATITIKRGLNFNQDVALSITGLPTGVTVDPAKSIIETKNTQAAFTFTASKTVAPGDYTLKVSGNPARGGDAVSEFTLTVAKLDAFSLSMPFLTTALKQGESKLVKITIDRDKTFDQDVALSFEKFPKGITVEPAAGVIKSGESEARLTFQAAADAGLGEFEVKITGRSANVPDATHGFKFTVAK